MAPYAQKNCLNGKEFLGTKKAVWQFQKKEPKIGATAKRNE
jgi:hypothetical protein